MTIAVDIPTQLTSFSARPRASALELALCERLESGRAALPVLPSTATAALELANDNNASIGQFADLVSKDPPIAARFLAYANSAFYSRGLRIRSLHDAIARVGISGARDLVLQIVYAQTLRGLKYYQEEVAASFKSSVLSAQLCRVIASELHLTCRDSYLCGLLHDIGESRVYRILSEVQQGKLAAPSEQDEAQDLVQRYHARAGAELAAKWKLPPEIVEVCRKHTDVRVPESTELRVVRIADLLTTAIKLEANGGDSELDADALQVLQLGKSEARAIVLRGIELLKKQ